VDLNLTLTALVDGIRIGGQTDLDKGYGGMTCRFGSATDVRMENDRGLIQSTSLNHVVARWVDWTAGSWGRTASVYPTAAVRQSWFTLPPCIPPEWIVRAYGPVGLAYRGFR